MKNQTLYALMVLMAAALPAFGQKVLTQKPGSTAITRVETALNHLTVVELREPVLSVASGSQAIRVEWRGNKVFIEPTEANVSTNLFIWTKSGRLNYELEPAGQVGEMDFAIDQAAVPRPAAKPRVAKSDPSSGEWQMEAALLGATPVEMGAYKMHPNRVHLLIKDTAHQGGRLFIRYAVVNSTNHLFEITSPQVFFLVSPRSRMSLVAQRNFQLPDSERIESNGEVSLDVIRQQVENREVGPDGESLGIIEVKAPPTTQGPTVLRVVLPGNGYGEISAVFVL
jgi:hypothetical protein